MTTPTFSVEVLTLSVSDIERSIRFYVDKAGFQLDVDYAPSETFRVVQITPPGSHCSIQFGKGLTDAQVGSARNIFLVVTDIAVAREYLIGRGIDVSPIHYKMPIGAWNGSFAPGVDPKHADYASFANFSDPDGNGWVLQEKGYQNQ